MTQLPDVRPIEPTLGGPVNLDNVVGRDEVIAGWWRALETRSLRVTEPRRFGKSTVFKLMSRNPPEGWLCLHDTVQDAGSTERLIEQTLSLIAEQTSTGHRVKEKIRSLGQAVATQVGVGGTRFELAADFRQTPFDAFESALRDVHDELEASGKRLVIIWDEFTDCLRAIRDSDPEVGPRKAADALALFRAMRERVCGQRIRWILSGSIGLHHVLGTLPTVGAVNDITAATLGTLDEVAATWLARCLMLGMGLRDNPEVAALLASTSSGIPYVLEKMVEQMSLSGAIPTTPMDARTTLMSAADSMDSGADLVPLLERIRPCYGQKDWRAACIILDSLVHDGMSLPELSRVVGDKLGRESADEESVRSVVQRLVEDRYITLSRPDRRFTWQFEAFRVLWQAKRWLE
ncbi:MAG: hypothetical protein FWD59_07040 [Micrococcales bacterium]|nr:hypothetical protein [Micrococcales bacterium]